MRRIPAIISDIDGVLVRGKVPIPRVAKTLSYVRQPLKNIFQNVPQPFKNSRIPFICLTNGGGMLEEDKAHSINEILNLQESVQLHQENLLLNFTPLRPVLSGQYKEKLILVAGYGKVNEIALSCGLKNFISMEEFCSLYPQQVEQYQRQRMSKEEAWERVRNRIDLKNFPINLERIPSFDGIFILNDPVYWEDCIQVITNQIYHQDYLQSFTNKNNSETSQKHIEIFTVNNDITYADTFRLNRLAFGPFTYTLQRVSKELHNQNLNIHIYGKPSALTYDYAKNHLQTLSEDSIGNVYMIGDNPKSDIRGGNNNGCVSILVKSGVFSGTNDAEDPAQHVVEDFHDAIKLIFEKENIPFQLEC
ncbi:hypothetical protein ABPG74_012423 [Tetrahymena malaccensis]